MTVEAITIKTVDHNFDNLDLDISSIDAKISELDQLILDLKNAVNRTQTAIRVAKAGDKVSLYRIVNSTMEILATYYQTHQRFLELKYRYRKEQDDLTYKIVHFTNIELKKIDSAADDSYYGVVEMLKKISSLDATSGDSTKPGLPTEIQTELTDLDNDEQYSLD